jgi:D-alanyl-D-alanine dipeptidase
MSLLTLLITVLTITLGGTHFARAGSPDPKSGGGRSASKEDDAYGLRDSGPGERNAARADTGRNICELEMRMIDAGLINVKEIDPTLLVELKYASATNFMGEAVYGDLKNCYLQKDAALKLKTAHALLKKHNPKLRLLLGDGCRPRSVQRRMWAIVKDTPNRKYIANPAAVSMHNYGAAVDVTIADEEGNRLDMGVPMDYFGVLSHPCEEARLLKEGKLTVQQVSHRRLLREVMTKAGFQGLSIEWWHFNACDRSTAAKRYRIIE